MYPRSFADSDGDGMGDLGGVRSRLPYLKELGVDALWLNPFYRSPQHDAGYDVADYREVDPLFGSLEQAELLIDEAHALGLRVLFDIVPNHTSSEHVWFQEALRTPPGEGAWSRYHCVRGQGSGGERPPNDWRSVFGGDGWSPIPDAQTGEPTGWWYLHLFDATQPDVNWDDPEVRAEHERVLRFWFDRGVDGFRIDVAHGLVKTPGYPDSGEQESVLGVDEEVIALRPQWDQPGVHDIYRSWREVADAYDPPRMYCGEVWVSTTERHSLYLRPDELHTAFNFHYLRTRWDAPHLREVIDHSLASAQEVGAPCTWVLSNHDVWRHASRLAPVRDDGTPDLAVGVPRARAASLFMLGLPGSAYLYQGEELGLPEVLDLPDELREDPAFHRTRGETLGRDGCRVPLPWSGTEPPFGFGPSAKAWLPQPESWAALTVARQEHEPDSTLNLYRTALRLRHDEPALGDGELLWRETGRTDVIAYERPARNIGEANFGDAIVVAMNLGSEPISHPWEGSVLVASGAGVTFVGGILTIAPDHAAWLRA